MDNDAAIQPDAPQTDFNIPLGSISDPMNDTPLITNQIPIPSSSFPMNDNDPLSEDDPDKLFIGAMRDIDYNADESYVLLNKVIKLNPNYGKAYAYLGWIHNRFLKNTAKAIELYKKAIELEKSFGLAYVYYAEALMKVNNYSEASNVINSAEGVEDIDLYSVNMIKGEIAEFEEKYDEAIKFFKTALKYSFSSQSANSIKTSIERAMQKQSDHLFHLQSF